VGNPTGGIDMDDYPIRLVVTDDLRRSRVTVFFRYLLALPHVVWLMLYGIAAYIVLFIAWIAALFTGRVPAGLHRFLAGFLRYSTRVNAYMYLVANQFPPFGAGGEYSINLEVAGPEQQGRLGIFFRGLLVFPALALAGVLGYAMGLVAFGGWFYALGTGRMSEGLRDLGAYCLRFQQRTTGYYLLLTSRYPSLGGINLT
jgi:hypothetical protein